MPNHILCVAEKPSIAKSVVSILSSSNFTSRNGKSKYNKNYDFQYRYPGRVGWTSCTMTSVSGHLMETDFVDRYRDWRGCDPNELFEAPIKRFVKESGEYKKIAKNLEEEARRSDLLMIWTDCDREGEHIGSEIVDVCKRFNGNIRVKRARFSAIIANQIHRAFTTPVDLDMLQAAAVEARMDLDLRLGAAFTRNMTMGLQSSARVGHHLDNKVISYGSCQFPCLGFVVDQYDKVKNFIPEPFWYLRIIHNHPTETDEAGNPSEVLFSWNRGKLFEKGVVEVFWEVCLDAMEGGARVVKVETKETKKWKPLPLTTVELQKAASRLLHLTPKKALDIAEKLYQQGYVSYPRTETDQFDKDFDFMELINKQTGDNDWGAFAQRLSNGEFERPRNGSKNDKAHPPIHPTGHVSNLAGDDKRVYEFITRRYLACCSKNAVGNSTTVEIDLGGERFTASGLIVLQRNYLDVYIYDKWANHPIPEYQPDTLFVPDVCEMKEGTTGAPSFLTEADLVNLMDKNGIGTDATIAEHISKVIEREYVMTRPEGRIKYLVPSTLGMGLIRGYNEIGFEKSLSKPQLRRETEIRMTQICSGDRSKRQVLDETLEEYREVYLKSKLQFNVIVNSVSRFINGDGDGAADDDDDGGGGGGGGGGGRGGRGGAAGRGRGGGGRGRGGGGGGGGAGPRGPPPNDSDDDDENDGRPGGAGARGRGRGNGSNGAAGPSRGTAGGGGGGGTGRGGGRGGGPSTRKKNDDNDNDNNNGGGGGSGGGAAPMCKCQEQAALRTVAKEGPNKGRQFYSCPNGPSNSCGFFEWSDNPSTSATTTTTTTAGTKRPPQSSGGNSPKKARPNGTSSSATGTTLSCACELEVALRTVTKEGPNQGRQFYVCSKVSQSARCRFFQWADEEPSASGSGSGSGGTGGGGGGGQTGSCFRCGKEGHWSNACPEPNVKSSQSRAPGGGGGSSSRTGSCYKCGEEGHWAAECPNPDGGGMSRSNSEGKGRGRGRGRGKGRGRSFPKERS